MKTADFAYPYQKGAGLSGWLDSLPRILAGRFVPRGGGAIAAARAKRRAIIWGMGGHVIKCGLAPVLIDLMRRGYATVFAMNGSAAIHDFEIALAGHTSEDVEAVLPDGRFGAAEETGREMNRAISGGVAEGLGMGESLGRWLELIAPAKHAASSLLMQAYANGTPVTVHVAIGTDTPHMHPAVDAAAIGSGSHRDFRLLAAHVADLNDGGVYLNVGSAVVLPEVFLKAVSAVRNLGHPLAGFHHRELRFCAALPAARECGAAAARGLGRRGLCDYRASRADDSAAGGRADRERYMSDQQQPEIELGLAAAAGQPDAAGETPFWGYNDLLLFIGLAPVCLLLGYALVKLPLHLLARASGGASGRSASGTIAGLSVSIRSAGR